MSERIGTCPSCGGDITETEKAFGCSNWKDKDGGCKFRIWKTIAKREITAEEAATLIENGKTPLLEGFVSKQEKPFAAHLVLTDGEVKFDFPPKQ